MPNGRGNRPPASPNSGAISAPTYCSEPYTVSSSTDPVRVMMYQPRIRILDLAGPGGQQIRQKLEAKAADRERGKDLGSAVAAAWVHRNGMAYISPPLVHSAFGPRSSFSELPLPTLRS